MGIRTSNSPWKIRNIRPDILKLEDRVVPGEMFGTSMFWAMGAFADPTTLLPNYPSSDPSVSGTVRVAPQATPDRPYVDSSTLTVCQIGSDSSAVSDNSRAAPPQGSDAPTPGSDTSNQVFAGMGDDDAGNLFDDLSGGAMSMGDVLHPGAQTPSIPNAAVGAAGASGAVGGSTMPSAVPGMSPSFAGGGGSAAGGHNGAALATLANFTGGVSTGSAATSAAAQSGGAASAGGSASPLFKAAKVATPDKAHPDAANGAAPFSPAQISQAYGLNLISNTGAGQTIYIVDAYNDPNIASDLATFDAQWGLPAANLTVHKMSNRVANNTSWGVEESLDVEWAHAIAPGANIVLVEATSSSNANLFAAVNYATNAGAKIVSMSFGGTDQSSDSTYNTDFEHSGVTYIASAGDTALEYPAASPYVLSVGGTSLTLTTGNAYSSESAWSSSGGGVSKYEALPAYQKSFGITNSKRSIPDVAWVGDPNTGVYVYDSFINGGGGWYEVGGTSVGTPSWAGLIALADQGKSTPLSTNSLTTRAEYSAATGSLYASNYHDVTTGSNGHAAGTGYDLVTGVGTPKANNLIPWLTANG